jgi:DNA-binding NarL/FixJ family response regulator
MYHGDEDIHRALMAGASTYLLKDMLSDDLMRVIREVHAGQRALCLTSRCASMNGPPGLR